MLRQISGMIEWNKLRFQNEYGNKNAFVASTDTELLSSSALSISLAKIGLDKAWLNQKTPWRQDDVTLILIKL